MKNIFAVIVIYNGMRRNWIEKCLKSIQNSSVPVSVIAVDNNSSDDSASFIESNFPEVTLILSKTNLGFGGANNIGLKKAVDLGGDYFFLLNQDAWVNKNTIEKLVSVSESHSEYAILSPVHLNGSGEKIETAFLSFINNRYCPEFLNDRLLGSEMKSVYDIRFINAAAWLLTKECLKKVGGFSPSFFHYGEDDNYCHRVWYKKLKVGVVPQTSVCHDTDDRAASKFDEDAVVKLRHLVMDFSNPNVSRNLEPYLRQLKNKALKYKILRYRDEYEYHQKIYLYLKENKDLITENLKLSKSSQDYLFLSDKN